MEIVSETQHRAMAFIAAANRGGYKPNDQEVGVWMVSSQPRRVGGIMSNWLLGMGGAMQALQGVLQSTVNHMEELTWLERSGSGGILLTPLGKALLRATEEEADERLRVVVLDSEDPVSYSSLIGEIAEMGSGMLVDPYLEVQGLVDVWGRTSVRRVLVGDSPKSRGKRVAMAVQLGTEEREDPIDVRVASGLHDRLIITDDGGVWTLGKSLNGIQSRKTVTVLSPLPSTAAAQIVSQYQELWTDATPLLEEGSA